MANKRTRMMSGFLLVVALLFAGSFAFANGQKEGATSSSTKVKTVKNVNIGFSIVALNAPYYVAMERAARQTAEKVGAKISVLNAADDIATQINQINTFLVQGINGLIVNSVTEYGTEPVIKKVVAQGVPVVAIDRNLYGDYIAYVGIDQWKAGVLQGNYITKTLLPNGGNIVLLEGQPGDPANIGRMDGMLSVLNNAENKGKYKILGRYAAYYSQSQGLTKMEQAIASFGSKIDLVYAANDAMGLGALQALQEAGLTKVMICSVDGQKQAYQQIMKGGQYKSTVVNNSWVITQIAVRVLDNYLTKGMTPEQTVAAIKKDDPSLGKGVYMEGNKDIITGTVLVNADNVKSYYDPNAVF